MAIVVDKSGSVAGVDKHIPSAQEEMASGKHQIAIVPSDTVDIPQAVTELRSNDGGDVAIVTMDNNVEVYTMVAGERLPLTVKRVNATGTTSADLVGWY